MGLTKYKPSKYDLAHKKKSIGKRILTKHAQEWKVEKLLLGHDDAVLRKDTAKDHHVHGRLVIADNDGRVGVEMLLAHDPVGDATGLGSEMGEEAGDNVVDRITLIQNSTDYRDDAAGDGHGQGGEENHDAFEQELGLLGQDGQDRGQHQVDDWQGGQIVWDVGYSRDKVKVAK